MSTSRCFGRASAWNWVAIAGLCAALVVPARAAKEALLPEIELQVQPDKNPSSVAFSPDGNWLASGSGDRFVKIWNPHTGELKGILKGHKGQVFGLAFTPDSQTLVSGDETSVRIWDVQTGRLRRVIEGSGAYNVAISPDGQSFATVDGQSLSVWDIGSGQLHYKRSARGEFRDVAFTPDGKSLATVGMAEFGKMMLGSILPFHGRPKTAVKLRDIQTGDVVRAITLDNMMSFGLAFSADGRIMVAGDVRVSAYDVMSGKRGPAIQLPGFLTCVAVSRDGRVAVVGTSENQLCLLDLKANRILQSVKTGASLVLWLEFSPDGRTFASGNADNSVKIWQTDTARLLATMYALPPVENDAAVQSVSNEKDSNKGRSQDKNEKELVLVRAEQQTASARAKDLELLPGQYLTTTPEGYFSGSPVADRYISVRLGRELYPAECFQARFRRPELLRQALSGAPIPTPAALRGPHPPAVRFITPQTGALVPGEAINVTLEATDDSDVASVVLFVNGARVAVKPLASAPQTITRKSKDVPTAHRIARTFIASVPLPPNETSFRLQAIAVDDEQLQSRRSEISVAAARPAQTVAQNLLGLCVGVSRYEQEDLNLKFADSDANALSGALNGEKNSLYQGANLATITNERATRQNVFAAIDALTERVGHADTVVVALSGHGWRSEERKFFFATHDIRPTSEAELERTSLPWDDLIARLITLSERSKRVIVLLDACHSGTAADSDEMVKAIISANAGVMIFASSRGSEVSLEDARWQHGAFTLAVLEALEGKAGGENLLSLSRFASYVVGRVGDLTEDEQHPQPFMLDFVGTSPVFATGVKTSP